MGTYLVEFRSPTGATETKKCVVSEGEHLCTSQAVPITDADIEAIEKGGAQ